MVVSRLSWFSQIEAGLTSLTDSSPDSLALDIAKRGNREAREGDGDEDGDDEDISTDATPPESDDVDSVTQGLDDWNTEDSSSLDPDHTG